MIEGILLTMIHVSVGIIIGGWLVHRHYQRGDQ